MERSISVNRGVALAGGDVQPRQGQRTGRSALGVAAIVGMLGVVMAGTRHTSGPAGALTNPWGAHIQRMDEALTNKDVGAAGAAWRDALGAGLGTRGWEGLVAVGDASLRIGEAAGSRRSAEAKARKAYLAAFFRAREQGSFDGVLRTAEAFAGLGDREVVEQVLRVADGLAARRGDAQAAARVRAFRERWGAVLSRLERPEGNRS